MLPYQPAVGECKEIFIRRHRANAVGNGGVYIGAGAGCPVFYRQTPVLLHCALPHYADSRVFRGIVGSAQGVKAEGGL